MQEIPYNDKIYKTEEKEESKEKIEKNKFFKYIENESKDINYELFKDYITYFFDKRTI